MYEAGVKNEPKHRNVHQLEQFIEDGGYICENTIPAKDFMPGVRCIVMSFGFPVLL